MAAQAETLNRQAIRDSFLAWEADEESLDAQVAESLSALEAYQSHLDAWQLQLVHERNAVEQAQEQQECDRAAAASLERSSVDLATELSVARQQIASLTSQLLSSNEERHKLEQLVRDMAAERECDRSEHSSLPPGEPRVVPPQMPPEPSTDSSMSPPRNNNPVLGSIVEQFGKLRQQRALDRQTGKISR
ncbi:MAG: hypothetical protein L0Z07_06175 [Planctomycetes bacterium]|nr:hypothetical protein [Planctomycetota bacterium]